MRILHVYKDYWPVIGGIENHVRLLAERQARRGHEVTVLVTARGWRGGVERRNGVRIIRAGRLATIASTPLSLSLPVQLARQRPDITHLQFPYPVGELSQLLLGRSRYTVVSYQSDVVRQKGWLALYRPLMLRLLDRADVILATSPAYIESSPVLRRFQAKCRVVPLGIDPQPFQEVDRRAAEDLRQRLGGGPIVLFVGVLRYYKGVQYLIEAMRQVAARCLIVGDGPMRARLEAQVKALGLRERIVFLGRVSEAMLPVCYAAADVFVLPACARSEAFGLVQVEAMTSGLPVISTELGTGTSYVNQHGVSGWVVPPRDSEALAHALGRLLGDEALRQKLAAGARKRAEQFTAERMVEAIEAVYRSLG